MLTTEKLLNNRKKLFEKREKDKRNMKLDFKDWWTKKNM